MLTDHLPHGDGQIAYAFLSRLAERGHRIHAAAPRVELQAAPHPNLHVHLIKTTMRGALGRVEYMLRVRMLFERLDDEAKFDLIHQLNPVFSGVSLATTGCSPPIVLGTYVARWPAMPGTPSSKGMLGRMAVSVRKSIDSLQQHQARALLLTAPAALNRVAPSKANRSKIRWIGHGVDIDTFSPAPDYASDERMAAEQAAPSILFLANISWRKGIATLLKAFALVLQELPTCRLTVAGDGPQYAAMQQLAEDLGVASSVTFLGRCSKSIVPELYRNHAVYCLPSLGEPYATSVLEALSCGRPVVVTDAGGLPAMVPEGGGLRVPLEQPEPMAEALLSLLRDPEERRQMAIRNRAHAVANLSWTSIVGKLEQVYREVLG
jgi:glycosyltransferase involved in cell wall biosynthesis